MFTELQLVPDYWTFPQNTPPIADFVIDNYDFVSEAVVQEHHYESVDTTMNSTNFVLSTQAGFTNLFIEAARYWLMQDTINFTSQYVGVSDGSPLVFGPGPFLHVFGDGSTAQLAKIVVDVTYPDTGEAHKRLGGAFGLARVAWVSMGDTDVGEAPKWCSTDHQTFIPRSACRAVFGFVKEGCSIAITPWFREGTAINYRLNNSVVNTFDKPADMPSYTV